MLYDSQDLVVVQEALTRFDVVAKHCPHLDEGDVLHHALITLAAEAGQRMLLGTVEFIDLETLANSLSFAYGLPIKDQRLDAVQEELQRLWKETRWRVDVIKRTFEAVCALYEAAKDSDPLDLTKEDISAEIDRQRQEEEREAARIEQAVAPVVQPAEAGR